MKVVTYKQWKAERGNPLEVELIDFIDFVRVNNSVYKFKEEGNTYTGEIWDAKSNGKLVRVIIKIECPDIADDNIGWNYKKEYTPECIDYWVNPLVDEYDTVIQRIKSGLFKRQKEINLGLQREIEKEELVIKTYEKILNNIEKDSKEYNAIIKYLNFMKSPTIKSMKEWIKINKNIKNKIKKLCQIHTIAPIAEVVEKL